MPSPTEHIAKGAGEDVVALYRRHPRSLPPAGDQMATCHEPPERRYLELKANKLDIDEIELLNVRRPDDQGTGDSNRTYGKRMHIFDAWRVILQRFHSGALIRQRIDPHCRDATG